MPASKGLMENVSDTSYIYQIYFEEPRLDTVGACSLYHQNAVFFTCGPEEHCRTTMIRSPVKVAANMSVNLYPWVGYLVLISSLTQGYWACSCSGNLTRKELILHEIAHIVFDDSLSIIVATKSRWQRTTVPSDHFDE